MSSVDTLQVNDGRFEEPLVRTSADALLVLDPTGLILFRNQAAEEMFNLGAETVARDFACFLVPGEGRDVALGSLDDTQVGGALVYKAVRQCRDGGTVLVDVTTRVRQAMRKLNSAHKADLIRYVLSK